MEPYAERFREWPPTNVLYLFVPVEAELRGAVRRAGLRSTLGGRRGQHCATAGG